MMMLMLLMLLLVLMRYCQSQCQSISLQLCFFPSSHSPTRPPARSSRSSRPPVLPFSTHSSLLTLLFPITSSPSSSYPSCALRPGDMSAEKLRHRINSRVCFSCPNLGSTSILFSIFRFPTLIRHFGWVRICWKFSFLNHFLYRLRVK